MKSRYIRPCATSMTARGGISMHALDKFLYRHGRENIIARYRANLLCCSVQDFHCLDFLLIRGINPYNLLINMDLATLFLDQCGHLFP